MPKKIGFRVVHASSEDEDHRAVQLNVHSPATRGWQSNRFCLYPQDLIIQLERYSKIRKIQILSHQFLIATKIEFYVGDVPDGSTDQWQNAHFKRLGYVEMTSNDRTNYTARELKSVHVDVKGSFVKLLIHKNHLNRLNIFHQVGIIALNIIGDHEPDYRIIRDDADSDRPDVINRPDYISPLDDLAFDIYQDPEIANIIRQLEKRKRDVVMQEKFEDAKKIKACIKELQQAGQKLSKLEVEKRRAIEAEDYDVAALKKTEIDECRQQVYREHLVDDILRPTKGSPRQVLHTNDDSDSVRQRSPPQRHSELPLIATPLPLTSPRNKFSSPVSRDPYDERILPAIAKKQNLDLPPESRLTMRTPFSDRPTFLARDDSTYENLQNEEGENSEETETLNSKDQRSAAELINVFGHPLATKAFSKSWSRREEAVMEVHNQMQELDSSSDAAFSMMRASTVLINRAIKDKVISVFNAGLHLLRMILTKYISKHRIQRSEVNSFLEDIMPNLLTKTGETAQRQRDITKDFILEASQFKDVKPVQTVVTKCLVPVTPSVSARLALSRTEIVESLYKVHGLTSGLSVENIMKFALASLSHSSGDVRQKAESLIITLYQDVGAPVRQYLPTDGPKTRKNVVYKQLFVAFDAIDEKSFPHNATANKKNDKQKKANAEEEQPRKPRNFENPQITNKRMKDEKRTSRLPVKRTNQAAVPRQSIPTDDQDIPPDAAVALDDKICIFCGETNEQFTPAGLDFHYWQNCPMLTRCTHCKTTIELSELTKHLLSEDCKNSESGYSRCPRCTEAIPKLHYRIHISQRTCNPAERGKIHCPLCHLNIPSGDEAWRQHLAGKDGCKENPRRIDHGTKQGKTTSRTAK